MTDFSAIKKLFNINEPCGYMEGEFAHWVKIYGGIPQVLRDYYAELGAHEALNNTQDFLIKPAQFEEYGNPDYLVFYSENQGVSVWGIKKEDVLKDNPPVYENYGDPEWFLTTNTIYEFLLSMAHLQAAMSMDISNEEFVDITPEQAKVISDNFAPKNADSGLYTGVSFYGNYDDTIIIIMKHNDKFALKFLSNDEDHFDETENTIEDILSKY